MNSQGDRVALIWSIAELLRHDYRPSEYGKVVLPFTVLRRLDCGLAATKDKALERAKSLPEGVADHMRDLMLFEVTGQNAYNVSRYDFRKLIGEPENLGPNLKLYVNGFPETIKELFAEHFDLFAQIDRLEKANLLLLVVQRFASVDLDPAKVRNEDMGSVFEELIRRFSEQSNETAGEHFTPREVIRLMVDLLFVEDLSKLTEPGKIVEVYDPACGTGGMLAVAEDYLHELNPDATLFGFGQEINGETYAISLADTLIKGGDPSRIRKGNSFTEDGFPDRTFDYMLSNPPFGVEWKKVESAIRAEADRGSAGRFGAGLPRVSDGSLLFVQHMVSKFRRDGETSRLAVVLNGSPLFTGGAGSGESEIRRWIIENDWLEAIIALPDQLFYNTGISTYVWIITNRKTPQRRGKVQLVNGVDLWRKMRRSLGDKRKELGEEDIATIVRLFGDFAENERSKIFDNEAFGYNRITVERPLRLNFAINAERIERVKAETGFANLAKPKRKGAGAAEDFAEGERLQAAIIASLTDAETDAVWKQRDAFTAHLKRILKADRVTVPANVFKAVLSGLSERDETADVCTDAKGNPEPDADLRDTENVPLTEDIEAYFAREVLPHVPDAWIDHSKTVRGYEIPFTRHFYVYQPPRPLEEIDADLRKLGAEIQNLLNEVMT
ncbi:MAG: SAM-dependent DNA methyltransferase [Microbacteriaceae bacterium]|nr:SAM-dependent DNA methyltransferase [Microbacteriaceae bacterium]